jgi:hypothetical protein
MAGSAPVFAGDFRSKSTLDQIREPNAVSNIGRDRRGHWARRALDPEACPAVSTNGSAALNVIALITPAWAGGLAQEGEEDLPLRVL